VPSGQYDEYAAQPQEEGSRPVPYRMGHEQPEQRTAQKQSTMANLRAAAAGIHVSLISSTMTCRY
jgi:hypothetical protein